MARVIAVDGSGRKAGEPEAIWLAVVENGTLFQLENGFTRHDVVDRVIELGREQPHTVAGFDFAFSFPIEYIRSRRWSSGRAIWTAMGDEGEAILADPRPPFWGRKGSRAQTDWEPLRRTERQAGAKSVFQISGAGTVGTGSIRGMPQLLRLAAAGWSIWPFDDARWPLAVEIYPRLLTGPVVKSRRAERARLATDLPAWARERATTSEDALDAAVSALRMSEANWDLAPARDEQERLEGAIWRPAA